MTAPTTTDPIDAAAQAHVEGGWSDGEALELLALRDEGIPFSVLSCVWPMLGYPARTRNALIGKAHRINTAADKADRAPSHSHEGER